MPVSFWAVAAANAAGLLVAFDVTDQALLLRDLARRQHVLLVLVGIFTLAEQKADRGADQLETLAEEVFQIAFVVRTAKISVKDLKQSRANKATSRKNW